MGAESMDNAAIMGNAEKSAAFESMGKSEIAADAYKNNPEETVLQLRDLVKE